MIELFILTWGSFKLWTFHIWCFYIRIWWIFFSLCRSHCFSVSSVFSVVARDKCCPSMSKAGLISVASKQAWFQSQVMCACTQELAFVLHGTTTLTDLRPYFQKCNNSIASSKSGMCKLSKKLRCRRAEEHLHQVKKCDYFHGYQQLLIAIIDSYSGRSS